MSRRMAMVTVFCLLVSVGWRELPAVADEPAGRFVLLGPWAGLVRCEAGPTANFPPLAEGAGRKLEVRADSKNPRSTARGPFQFIDTTWDWVAERHGQDRLVGKDPRRFSVARQLRQAARLSVMAGGGIVHWECGHRFNTGSPWVFLSGESKTPKNPRACFKRTKRFVTRDVARSVCGWQ
jgi:hypothetical protein